jgi:5-methylcytosine-specific restriction endonuclease McrA
VSQYLELVRERQRHTEQRDALARVPLGGQQAIREGKRRQAGMGSVYRVRSGWMAALVCYEVDGTRRRRWCRGATREIAEAKLAELRQAVASDPPRRPISVKLDREEIRRLEKENQWLRAEVARLEARLHIHTRRAAHRVPTILRRVVLERDDFTCRYCGCRFAPVSLDVDHVIPVRRGGVTDEDNLVTACRSCNRRKGERTPDQAGLTLLPHPAGDG